MAKKIKYYCVMVMHRNGEITQHAMSEDIVYATRVYNHLLDTCNENQAHISLQIHWVKVIDTRVMRKVNTPRE